MFNRTYNKVINTKSKDYNYYWTKILIQYTWIPALFLLGCAFFIESHIYHGGDYDTLSFILFGIFGETIAYSLKLYFYSLIYKGLFVSKYALLTAAEEVVEEKLNEQKYSSYH